MNIIFFFNFKLTSHDSSSKLWIRIFLFNFIYMHCYSDHDVIDFLVFLIFWIFDSSGYKSDLHTKGVGMNAVSA